MLKKRTRKEFSFFLNEHHSKFETFKTVGGNPDKHYAILRVAKLKTQGRVTAALSLS